MVESIKLSFEKQKINLPVVDKLQSILIVCRDKKLSCPELGLEGLHDPTEPAGYN